MRSRYVAFTQQPYCCVPACLQMAMYRRGTDLVEQEELGYALGLTVPKEDTHMFTKVRTGEKPSSGWGTQIQNPEFGLDKAFTKLNIPLTSRIHTIQYFVTKGKLKKFLEDAQTADGDILVCFKNESGGGHVCVFDRIERNDVWLVDPERNVPKHRKVSLGQLYDSMIHHGTENFAGCWEINPL